MALVTVTARRFREPSPTEAIYLKTATQVVSRSLISGRITEAQFRQALAYLEAAFVILRARIEGGHFVERSTAETAPLRWLSGAQVTAEALYDEGLATSLDLSASIYAVSVLDHGSGFEVFMVTSHAVTDATSLLALHAALIQFCDCIIRGVEPAIAVQTFPETIDSAVDRCLAALGLDERATAPAVDDGPFLHLPMRVPPDAAMPSPVRHRLERFTVAPDVKRAVAEASHRHGVSTHAVVAAAFARAIGTLSGMERRPILIRCSIDMRRRLDPHVSVDLVFSAVTAHVSRIASVGGSIFGVARAIFDDIHEGTRDGRIFLDYHSYPKSFGDTRDVFTALNISDLGAIAFHAAIETLKPTGFEYATGVRKRYPNISITIFEGRLVATATYIEAFIAPEVMRRLADLVVRALEDCVAG
jgi:hypothetical protein